jgi:mannose-6-phosphate isomerase-like protein (cupin superfamily)
MKYDQFVFSTEKLKRYKFPTHINDLIIDRYKSSNSEVFMVIVEPEKSVHHHLHIDTEQVFYIIEGTGILCIGAEKTEYNVKPGDVVRIPPSTLHSIKTDTDKPIKYLCIDCFGEKQLELTWDEHVKAVCKSNNWDYNKVIEDSD